MDEILKVLPQSIVHELSRNIQSNITEIRLRSNTRAIVIMDNNEIVLSTQVTTNMILEILLKVSKNSIYAIQNDINNGFVIIRGGHRIGICGEVVYVDGKIKNIKNICSLNIRVARQVFGCADSVLSEIVKDNKVENTLIISPPGCGKTTLLRDIVRQLSNGVDYLGITGKNISLVDERGEIASSYDGVAYLDVGVRTDIMSGVEKYQGMKMMIRSMAPDIIATDEIGKDEDILAIKEAIISGVNVIVTMHGNSLSKISKNPKIKEILDMGVFGKIIILSSGKKKGVIEKIYSTQSGGEI